MSSVLQRCTELFQGQVNDLLDIIYPPYCGVCEAPADSDDRLICNRCWDKIAGLDTPYCSLCRQLLVDTTHCPNCHPAPMIIFSLGYFTDPLRTIIHDLKFSGLKPLAMPLGTKLGTLISVQPDRPPIDFILPVPLHHTRRYRRGFNQAEEIAHGIGRVLDVPVMVDMIYVTRKTRQQARLPAALREANVRGAFAVDDEPGILRGAAVLLVDDVTTTGATLRENEIVLRAAGVKTVVAAVVATAV